MQRPEQHIVVCGSFRATGEPKGTCHKKNSLNLLPYLENELSDRGMDGVTVSACTCLKVCEQGPVLVVYPANQWYGKVESEANVDQILDAMQEGKVCEPLLLH